MKKFIISYFVLGLSILSIQAQNTTFAVSRDNFQSLEVTFDSPVLWSQQVTFDGQQFSLLQMEGAQYSQKIGEANLPTFTRLIETPLCRSFSIEVSQPQYDTILLASLGATHPLMPLQPSRSKSDTNRHALVWNKESYARNNYTGADLAIMENVGIARDRNLARLQISPIRYNAVEGSIIVCRHAVITIRYNGADSTGSMQMFERYHSPAFSSGNTLNSLYPKNVSTAAPIRYLIVAHSMFRNQLDDFVAWKKRKGFITDIVYTDNPAVGSTNASIMAYLQSQYTNATTANPAPTYVLLVGDHEQIPASSGAVAISSGSSHITDLYFMSWTADDHIPDCYYGRFSAQNISQLTPQIEKTLMYEQYTFADPSFLDRAVMVAGVDGGTVTDYGYTHADPAMDYAITNYVNGAHGFSDIHYFKNNTSIVPSASNLTVGSNSSTNSASVRSYYNQGAGWINYSAHGSATSWGTPNFTATHASEMTNTQKFGLMIGNCCLTNKFETQTCLGEALLRKGNYCGAVGYIGGTNSTYWYEDFYWAVGLRTSSTIGPSMSMAYDSTHLGNYDAVCHTHGESHNQWIETQGAMVFNGNAIVESGTSSTTMKHYYWEIYQLMGDPSLMPYFTQADTIAITAPSAIPCGTTLLTLQAVPYAYIALTDTATHTLIASTYADNTGSATLTLPASLVMGSYEIAVSAQQYRTTFKSIDLIVADGPYVVATMTNTEVLAGAESPLAGRLLNLGSQTATNIIVHFNCNNPDVTLLTDSLVIDSISVGDTIALDSIVTIRLATLMPDMTNFDIIATTEWDSAAATALTVNTMRCIAPNPAIVFTDMPNYVLPSGHYTTNVAVSNLGHFDMPASTMELCSPFWQVHISPADTTPLGLAVNANAIRQFTIDIDSTMPIDIAIPLEVRFSNLFNIENATTLLLVGMPVKETFEGMTYHLSGWSQGTYPWTITNAEHQAGSYSARSSATLTHNQTSELTLSRNFETDDSISFYYKVSSEANYDKFHFYIDGTEMHSASGTIDWTRIAFPIQPGFHTFLFAYQKDGSVNTGSDCVWIDEIQLPQQARSILTIDDTLCYGQPYLVMDNPVNTLVPGSYHAIDTTSDTLVFINYVVLPQRTYDTAITACDEYFWDGTTYTQSTIITDTLTTEGECPLYCQYHLTINHSTQENVEATVCDSLVLWGNTYTQSGTYTYTLPNAVGCDSMITLQLTVHYSVSDTIEAIQDEAPYIWNNNVYYVSGTYSYTYETTEGCDSTIVLLLTITNENQGIDPASPITLTCYPNPTSGHLEFSQQLQSAIIFDQMGRKVMTLPAAVQADLRQLSTGIYTIEATLTDGSLSRLRLVITR